MCIRDSLGIERLILKGGRMYLYFVSDENKAYYESPAFGRILAWLQSDPARVKIREVNGKRSFLVESVPAVSEALDILEGISAFAPL